MSSSNSLLPGQRPPLFTVTDTDKGGVILIVTALCLALALISALVRAYVRYEITSQRFASDDGVLGGALVFYVVQAALVFYEIHYGFGKAIEDVTHRQSIHIQKALYGDGFLYILAVWTAKISSLLLFRRLSQRKSHRQVNLAVMGLTLITAIAAIFVVALRCNLSHPWIYFNSHGITCSALIPHWQTIAALDLLTEFALAAIGVYIIWDLQMAWSNKIPVMIALDTRLLIVIPIAFRLHYMTDAFDTRDPTLHSTAFTIATQIQIMSGIVLASVPTLRPFMIATATHYGAPAEGAKSHDASGQNSGSFNLRNLASKFSKKATSNKNTQNSKMSTQDNDVREGPPIPGAHNFHAQTNVSGGMSRDGLSRGSNDSKEMIIRKDVRYQVEYGEQR